MNRKRNNNRKIILIISLIVIILTIALFLIINVNAKYTNKLNTVSKNYQNSNKDTEILAISKYDTADTYYILKVSESNKEYYVALDKSEQQVLKEEVSKFYDPEKIEDSYDKIRLGVEDDEFVYETKKTLNKTLIFKYYDALTGEYLQTFEYKK